MEIINAIILGIIQGLTEFLPVSSSGHLEIAKAILGENKVGEESLLMTVVLHFATALSTIIIFRKDILEILSGLLQFKNNDSFWFSLKIVLSMIPSSYHLSIQLGVYHFSYCLLNTTTFTYDYVKKYPFVTNNC